MCSIQEVGRAPAHIVVQGGRRGGFGTEDGRKHFLGISKFTGRCSLGVQFSQGFGKDAHGGIHLAAGHAHFHGITLISTIVHAAEALEAHISVRNAGILEIARQPVPQNNLHFISKEV